MICWYCYWGWSKPVADIYQEAVRRLGGDDAPLHWGPSHIVWEDENFDSAQSCLDNFAEFSSNSAYSPAQLDVVRWSLEELAKLPDEQVEVCPNDYDGLHPELFPPTVDVVRINAT